MSPVDQLEQKLGLEFFGYQREALEGAEDLGLESMRACLYFRTGAGKTFTALGMLATRSYTAATVIAPPSTHPAWIETGRKFGVAVTPMSHAKFRSQRTKLKRDIPVIADEFHMFGGQRGQGWKKLDRLAGGLQAPLILASATPNYNDAERVYCIQHILDPMSCKGGFLEFLYTHCNTQQNPFGSIPLVDDETPFKNFKDASEFLASLPGVFYLPDNLSYQIKEVQFVPPPQPQLDRYGLDIRSGKIMASQIEESHTRIYNEFVDPSGLLRHEAWLRVHNHMPVREDVTTWTGGGRLAPVIIFSNHASIAKAMMARLHAEGFGGHAQLVTGDDSTKQKNAKLQDFRDGKFPILVGTTALATGTDGLDKVCDTMLIVDDIIGDDAMRRQLIGRIMPRGSAVDASKKQVVRIQPRP